MRPEDLRTGDQGDAVAGIEQGAAEIETNGVTAEHDQVPAPGQRVGHLDGLAEAGEAMHQRPEFGELFGQIGPGTGGDQQRIEGE